jgi:hypothetical protein
MAIHFHGHYNPITLEMVKIFRECQGHARSMGLMMAVEGFLAQRK